MMQLTAATAIGQQSGSIRGSVRDADFDAPMGAVVVEITDTGAVVQTDARGNYFFGDVAPGTYSVLFRKDGYNNELAPNVLVSAGELTDLDVDLSGKFDDMDAFTVTEQTLIGGSDEVGLLNLRFEAPSLIDSVGRDLLSRASVGSADEALNLISGATVAADATAVIRGLPDRYVSSQVNGVRLPSANEDKRAVELDQFPSAIIESVQVSKTFTPDQQGDASGGAVNIVLNSIPDEPIFNFSAQTSYNSQASGIDDFLSYDDGGVGPFGRESSERPIQTEGENWTGDVGVSETDAPAQYKFSTALGGGRELDNGVRVGGFFSLFYEKDSSHVEGAVNDQYWVNEAAGPGLTPQLPQQQGADEFFTRLFDITESQQFVQWGGLVSGGIEWDNNRVGLQYLYSHTAEDVATLAEDTRGKEFFIQGYDVNDPAGPGNVIQDIRIAPYLRTESLTYTERTTGTLQFSGNHKFEVPQFGADGFMVFRDPEFDWTLATSFADLDQPDKRFFGARWTANSFDPGNPAFGLPPSIRDERFEAFRPAANINLGNLQRIYKTIEEDSSQIQLATTLPFDQWNGDEGYFKVGYFDDDVTRTFDQESFGNFTNSSTEDLTFFGNFFEDSWSANWQNEDHPITQGLAIDVDYFGEFNVDAFYAMMDLPITSKLKLIGGARLENTEIITVLDPGEDADFFDPNSSEQPGPFTPEDLARIAEPYTEEDVLPALSMVYEVSPAWTVRAAYSETVARPTFKELVPILQQEFLGGPIFVGNPDLVLAELENYDLRIDYRPTETSLLSFSYFYKDIENPIENVQVGFDFSFTQPFNFETGTLSGVEFEVRQGLEPLWSGFEGLNFGANATFIDSEVDLPASQSQALADQGFPITSRDATNAPEYLYNIYFTYDVPDVGTQLGLFYTVRGDTLIAGDGLANVSN
ncbi:MAG: TonB-dependent receptor, partial [Planctomycetota bacterium]